MVHLYGDLHCHSTNSDGEQSPEDVMIAQRDAGRDFSAITDHEVITPDPGVSGITFLRGYEWGGWVQNQWTFDYKWSHHFVVIEPPEGDAVPNGYSNMNLLWTFFNTNEGCWIHHAHPSLLSWALTKYSVNDLWSTYATYQPLSRYFIELGSIGAEASIGTALHMRLRSYAVGSTFWAWDEGMRIPLVSVSDCHDFSSQWNRTYYGTMVIAEENTAASIVAALKDGRTYTSGWYPLDGPTYPMRLDIVEDGEHMKVANADGDECDFYFFGRGGTLLSHGSGLWHEYVYSGSEGYVHFVVQRRNGRSTCFGNPTFDIITKSRIKMPRPKPRTVVRHAPLLAHAAARRAGKGVRSLAEGLFRGRGR